MATIKTVTLPSTQLNASLPTSSPANPIADLADPAAWLNTIKSTSFTDAFYLLLLSSIPIFFSLARIRQAAIEDQKEEEDECETGFRVAWQQVAHHPALMGLVEQYIYGTIPWGPWDASFIQNNWSKKGYLKRLIRGGVIPIDIREGGVQIYQKSKLKWNGWKVEPPVYVQSKSRAYFEFVIVLPLGQPENPLLPLDEARRSFIDNLLSQDKYAVTVSVYGARGIHQRTYDTPQLPPSSAPLEVGGDSWFKFLLPFTKDRVLRRVAFNLFKKTWTQREARQVGVLQLAQMIDYPDITVPLLARRPYAVVRVEALDYTPVRLDEFVFRMARRAGFTDVWIEDEMSRAVAKLYEEYRIDWRIAEIL
jgi:hypothetical protein